MAGMQDAHVVKRSEYWKSQPRKYCDFCKCWIAENKPSIDFHEKGKRHLENVKKKIDELKKKSVRDDEAKAERDEDFRKMEEAALAAIKRDIANDPSMAAMYGVRIKQKVHTVEPRPEGYVDPAAESSNTSQDKESQNPEETNKTCDWDEAKSPEGYTYYWNTATGETTWEKPEGYVPREKKRKKKKKVDEKIQATSGDKEETTESTEISSNTKEEENTEETRNTTPEPTERSLPVTLAEIPLPGEYPDEEEEPEVSRAPRPDRPSPYGAWETIKEAPLPDLGLPKSNYDNQPPQQTTAADASVVEPPRIKFREKRVTNMPNTGKTTGIVFKKRKIGGAASNMRQRGNDV